MKNKSFLDNLIKELGSEKIYENEKLIFEVTEMIEQLMEDKKTNKSNLAQSLNVSISNISQMLNGTKNMTLKTVSDILFHLGERMTVAHESLHLENEIYDYGASFDNSAYSACLNISTPEPIGGNYKKQAA